MTIYRKLSKLRGQASKKADDLGRLNCEWSDTLLLHETFQINK